MSCEPGTAAQLKETPEVGPLAPPSSQQPNVWVNVYHITKNLNRCLFACAPCWRIYHSGLQIYSSEYSYGGDGIIRARPLSAYGCVFHESVPLGRIDKDPLEVLAEVRAMAAEWTASRYEPFHHNCNCFSQALARRLLGSGVPSYINAFSSCAPFYGCVLRCAQRLFSASAEVSYSELSEDLPEITDLSNMDKPLLDAALVQKARGGHLFAKGDITGALAAYKCGLKYLGHYRGPHVMVMSQAVADATETASVAKAMAFATVSHEGGASPPQAQPTQSTSPPQAQPSKSSPQSCPDDNQNTNGQGEVEENEAGSEILADREESPDDNEAETTEEGGEKLVVPDLLIVIQVNIAACFLKLGSHEDAIQVCTEVLEKAPTHAKALYRRGVGLCTLNQFEEAEADFKHALQIKPGDAAVAKELAKVKQKMAAQRKKEQAMYAKMFSNKEESC